MNKIQLAVFFGGVTVEHEVSVITGLQLMKHADRNTYDVIPVYVDKKGQWWTGDNATKSEYFQTANLEKPQDLTPFTLSARRREVGETVPGETRIDVAILCFHGEFGEAGNVQGLLELAGIPYQGPGVVSSAAAFDKILTRYILGSAGFGQTQYQWFTADQWHTDQNAVLSKIKELQLPIYVKPANGGSTVGIERVSEESKVAEAINTVLQYDTRVLVEAEVTDCLEVNVSVLGWGANVQASVPEQPIKAEDFLSYADKYQRGGKKSGMASATRRIPAPISASLTTKLQQTAKELFTLFDCSGVIRIDFFVDPTEESIYVIELNTLPGSMSFYLWEATDLPYPRLIDRLVAIAQERFAARNQRITSFSSNILQKNQV